jgi:phosphate transport system permease protein
MEPPASKASPPRSILTGKTISRRVKIADRAADLLIRTGGVGIIVIVALIFVFLLLETLPLFRPAQQDLVWSGPLAGLSAPGDVLALGIDEYESHLYYVDGGAGVVRFVDLKTGALAGEAPLVALRGARATTAYRTPSRDRLVIGTSDGRVLTGEVRFEITYPQAGGREIRPSYRALGAVKMSGDGAPLTHVHLRVNGSDSAWHIAAATADGRLFTAKFFEDEPAEDARPVGGEPGGAVAALALDYEGNRFFAATADGRLHQWYLEDNRDSPFRTYALEAPATAMDFLIGDGAVVLGLQNGESQVWIGVRESETDVMKPIRPMNRFGPLPAPVSFLQISARDKGFAVAAADGTVALNFSTSNRTVLSYREDAPIARLVYAPKLTALVALGADGKVALRSVHNPHPEISWRSLFGKVHYEGYDKPEHIWQSTGGTDDFEVKFGLVPLIIGTLKGAFYGLLFAVPIAVLAALYTSQLMAPWLRGYVKPTIEIMAALPSVVIGFLAGLWLAPRLEEIMVGTLLSAVVVPCVLVAAVLLWNRLPRRLRSRVREGGELVLVVPLVALGFWLSLQLGPWVEATFLEGSYKQWVFDVFGEQVEQRNSIVIGIAMGFAVIPMIFTISEDAFSNVPPSFRSASFALGASRWQTAWRVVLPTASPGVFSAVMIGFGRAVGETMIVLMATGNTPILSFSPFNGMRTLSANIAVEIPEAPVGGTLYRVLFVAALLLFALTFVVNTVAELVRQRLRQRYQAV